MVINSQRKLAIVLSKLKSFEKPSLKLEQYPTPSSIAGEWIWQMALRDEIRGKTFLDAASGPGILGLGALLMGAKKVFFVDKDEDVIETAINNYNNLKEEYEIGDAEFIVEDISLFDEKVDLVIQNPPFGTKEKHMDKKFLEKAFEVSKIVYSMHKYSTRKFVESICQDFKFEITDLWRYDFPIKKTFAFHEKPIKVVDVGLWRMEKSI